MAYVMKTSMSEEEQRVSAQQWGLWMQKLRRSISKRKPSLQDAGQSSHSKEGVEWRSDTNRLSSLQGNLRILWRSLLDEDSIRYMSPQHTPLKPITGMSLHRRVFYNMTFQLYL
jgi:hypothetical protein